MSENSLKLYRYHVWANKRIFDHLKGLPESVLTKEIESVFPTVSKVIEHMYRVDVNWLNVMKGKSYEEIKTIADERVKEIEHKSVADYEESFLQLSNEYEAFFETQTDLEKTIVTEHPSFGTFNYKLADLVLHVVNHGTYHRGNITAMLWQLGQKGIPTDYAFYI